MPDLFLKILSSNLLKVFLIFYNTLLQFNQYSMLFFKQTAVSVNRLDKFMNADELNPKNVEHDETESK